MAGVVTQKCLNFICQALGGVEHAVFSLPLTLYIGWGNGAGQNVASTDTGVFGEFATARVVSASSSQTTTTSGDTLQVVGTITADANRVVDNAGVLDASSGGNLLFHANFSALSLLTGDLVTFYFMMPVV